MKPQELRIGNLVNTPDGVKEVRSIDKFGITYSLDKKYYKSCTFDNIEGVELTEDWLLEFKFEYIGDLFDCNIYRKEIINVSEINGVYTFSLKRDSKSNYVPLTELKHIHNLQNLLFELNGDIH